MDYLYLGNSGPRVSKYILGSVTFGGTHGFELAGDVQADDARRLIDIAIEAGVNAFDTANLYSMGDDEKTMRAALKGRRDDVMLFSKAGFQIGDEEQLRDNLASFDITLSQEDCDLIEKMARPASFYPLWHRVMSAFERGSPSEIPYLEGYRQSIS